MTRETKIGLLVGLAFIILFGIILSEKGTSRNSEFATPPITAIKPLVELVPPTAPTPKMTRMEDQNIPTKIKVTMNDSADANDLPSTKLIDVDNNVDLVEKKIEPGPSNIVIKEVQTPNIQKEIATPKLAPELKKMLPPTPTRGLSQIPASKPTPTNATVAEPETAIAEIDTVEIKEIQKIELAENKPDSNDQFINHEIESGETLAGICRKYYPGQAYNMVKAVMEANNISDPKKIRPGQTLKMPPIDERLASAAPVANTVETTKTTSSLQNNKLLRAVHDTTLVGVVTPDSSRINLKIKSPAESKATQTYTVQDKDTLTKIAKRFYGNERAWTKIYEMNKNILKSPHAIRSGISLKVPVNELAVGPKVD